MPFENHGGNPPARQYPAQPFKTPGRRLHWHSRKGKQPATVTACKTLAALPKPPIEVRIPFSGSAGAQAKTISADPAAWHGRPPR
jgi:hypothetical protein